MGDVYEIRLTDNPKLVNITALGGTSGPINVGVRNIAVENLEGFRVIIYDHYSLIVIYRILSVSGRNSFFYSYKGMKTVHRNFYIDSCPKLTTLAGLDNVTEFGSTDYAFSGRFQIRSNPMLVNLNGLNQLVSVKGRMTISGIVIDF